MWYGTDAPWKGRGISPLRLTGTNALGDEGNVEHVLIHSGAKQDYHRTNTTLRVSPYVWCGFDTKCCGTESSNHEGRAHAARTRRLALFAIVVISSQPAEKRDVREGQYTITLDSVCD